MKKLLYTLCIAMLHCTGAFAQDKISYDVIKDDPNFFLHVRGGLIADIDFSDKNTRSGYYVTGYANLFNRIALGGDFVWGRPEWNTVAKNAATTLDKSMLDINARASLFFKSETKKQNVKITLKTERWSDSRYKYTNEKFINAPANTLTQMGLTGSAGFYRNNILDNFKRDTLFALEDKTTGTEIALKNAATYFSGMKFTAGFHISTTKNFVLNAINASTGENYGKKAHRNKVDIYIEGIYMPVIAVNGDITAKPENGGAEYSLKGKPDVRNFGYRLRVESYSTGVVGLGFRFEFGQRPGVVYKVDKEGKIKTMYLTAGIMIGLNV